MADMRAGAWVRVSTGGQDEKNQVPDIKEHCGDRHYQIREWYILHDASASKGEQQAELDRFLADMARGHINVLVAWHSWRLERRGSEVTLRLARLAREAGGWIESVQEPWFGKDEASAELMTAMTAVQGKEFSRTVRAGTQLAYTRIDENEAFRWKIPFGYMLAGAKYNKHLVPTDQGRQYVPVIFQRITEGYSLSAICAWLDPLGLRRYPHDVYHPDDRELPDKDKRVIHTQGDPMPWWPATVMNLIRNTVYTGHYSDSDGNWLHACEPLVDADVFRIANDALSDRNRRQRGPRGNPRNRAMLKGAIRCPRCGVPMHKNASPNTRTTGGGASKPYYRCRAQGPPASQRGGCGNNCDMALVDVAVNANLAEHWHVPIMRPVLVRGTDHQGELDQVAQQLRQLPGRGLDRAAEQAERERLWDDEDRIKGLPVTDDQWIEVETDEFYDEVYAALPVWDRGAWLAANGFTVTALKEGRRGDTVVKVTRTVRHERHDGQVLTFPVQGGQPLMTIIPPHAIA